LKDRATKTLARTAAGPLALITVLLATPRSAEAKLFELYAGAHTGLMTGWGSPSDPATAIDFFDRTHGYGVGVEVGAEVLEVSALISLTDIVSSGSAGTLSEFLLGFDGEFEVDDLAKPATFVRMGIFGGLGVGTFKAVDMIADPRRVANKGPVIQAMLSLDHYFFSVISVGLEARAGYHYFVPGSFSELSGSAQGGHFLLLLTARAHLDPFR
jgi:hypothetical protein